MINTCRYVTLDNLLPDWSDDDQYSLSRALDEANFLACNGNPGPLLILYDRVDLRRALEGIRSKVASAADSEIDVQLVDDAMRRLGKIPPDVLVHIP